MSFKTEIKTQWHGKEVKIRGKEVIGKSIYEVGLVVEGQAKLLAPKRYGYLAASITTQASDGTGTKPEDPNKYSSMVSANILNKKAEYKSARKQYSEWEMYIQAPKEPLEVYVGTPLEYGTYQEFGTGRMSAQPYLRPALELAKGHVLTIVKLNSKMHFKEYLTEKDQYKYRN